MHFGFTFANVVRMEVREDGDHAGAFFSHSWASGYGIWSTVWLWSGCQESEKPNEVPLGLLLLFGFRVESVTFVASAFIVLNLVCCLLFGFFSFCPFMLN